MISVNFGLGASKYAFGGAFGIPRGCGFGLFTQVLRPKEDRILQNRAFRWFWKVAAELVFQSRALPVSRAVLDDFSAFGRMKCPKCQF